MTEKKKVELTRETDLSVDALQTLCGKTVHPLDGSGVQPVQAGEKVKPFPRTVENHFFYCPDCVAVQDKTKAQ